MARWLPAAVRRKPERILRFGYRLGGIPGPGGAAPARVEEALRAAGIRARPSGDLAWELLLPWRAMVFGCIPREVDERVVVRVAEVADAVELQVECAPEATHNAHAMGVAAVLVLAAVVWLTGGWLEGLAAALTTGIAGGLWADWAREMSLTVLGRRLRRLAWDLGAAAWPGVPARMVDHTRRDPPLPS
jgi:hypothetical protein